MVRDAIPYGLPLGPLGYCHKPSVPLPLWKVMLQWSSTFNCPSLNFEANVDGGKHTFFGTTPLHIYLDSNHLSGAAKSTIG